MCSPSRHFRSASTASFRAYDRHPTRPHHDRRTEGVVPQERAREGLTYGRPRGATRVTGSGARSWSAEAPLPCYFPRDVFFCFFTFKLTIGAFAPVPRETGLDTGCFFDFPAMAILLGRGEWHGRSHRTGRGRMRCLCDGLGLSPKRWRVSAKCHSFRLGCESLNGRSWLLVDGRTRVIAYVTDRTNVVCCVSVRSSVVAAEALALLFSCSLWPERSGELVRDLCLTKSEEHTMHATVGRNEGVAGKWTDGLSRATGEAVVRDLLQFEGFRNHGNWMRRAGSWSPG